MKTLVFLGTHTISLSGASAGSLELESAFGVVPRAVMPQADLRSNPTYRIGVAYSKTATPTLDYTHADATIQDLGADPPQDEAVMVNMRRYFRWCSCNGTNPANGGAGDQILLKAWG